MRALEGHESHSPVGDTRVAALERHRLTRPQPLHDLQRFLELRHAIRARQPDRLQLLLAIADGHAHVEATVRDVVEGGHVLGDVDGLHERQEQDRGLETHAAGLRGQARQHGERLRPHRGMREQMMAHRHPPIAHARGGGGDLDRLVDDLRRRAIGRAPERREVKPDLHACTISGLLSRAS